MSQIPSSIYTVKEALEILKDMPEDAPILVPGRETSDGCRSIMLSDMEYRGESAGEFVWSDETDPDSIKAVVFDL